jgi:SpoIID/LytB domain protein
MTKAILRILGFSLTAIVLTAAHAQEAEPLITSTQPPRETLLPVPPGSTLQIAHDWTRRRPRLTASAPDHSLKTVWVRIFPILYVPGGDPYSRTQNVSHIQLQNSAVLYVYSLANHTLLGTTNTLQLDFSKAAFRLNNKSVALEPLYITPASPSVTQLNWDTGLSTATGIRLRGGFVAQKTGYTLNSAGKAINENLWSVTNAVDVDEYIQSVAASEAIYTWLPAALQAQAIAARTYGMYQVVSARAANRAYDLDPTTEYQSYRGVQFLKRGGWESIEQDSTNQASLATSGQVLTHNGEIIIAYFSANSGGVSCSVHECFDQADLPYLQSVPDAPGIQTVAGGTWGQSANLTPATIRRLLISMGLKPSSPVVRLLPLELGPSGRTWRLRVELTRGTLDLSDAETRVLMQLFGSVRSFLYSLGGVAQGHQALVGHGYGHGVGMSQWGAQLFAQVGWTAPEILQHFYVGTSLQNVLSITP